MKSFRIEAEKSSPRSLAGFIFYVEANTSTEARKLAEEALIHQHGRVGFTITSIRNQANYRPKLF